MLRMLDISEHIAAYAAVKRSTASMCRKECSINSATQCTAACTANHRGTWQISAYQCPTSQHGSIFVPLLSISWWFSASEMTYIVSGGALNSTNSILGGSAMPAQHTRSIGLLCGRPVALELSTGQLEGSGSWHGKIQTSAEDAFIYTVLKHLAY